MSGRVSELSTLAIRRYEEPDHDEVWALHNVALEAVGVHGGNGAWDDDLHHIDQVYLEAGGEFLVGVLDGHIVAMGAFKRISREAAEIKRIRVYPAFQRRGFGQAILERLERQAVELGYVTLHLETTVQQVAARHLYRNNGYIETGRAALGAFEVLLFQKSLQR